MPDPVGSPPDPAKKRRRRVPTSGAAEDCSGCRKRGLQCDRRRPYCSQCLQDSQDCPGYRTTLTWGVGVASRGKLRGLSLPIANASASSSGAVNASAATRPHPRSTPQQSQQRPRAYTYHDTSDAAAVAHDDGDDSRRKRVRMNPVKVEPSYASGLPPQQPQYPPNSQPIPFTNPFHPPPGPFQHQHHLSASHPLPSYDLSTPQPDLFPLQTSLGPPFNGGATWAPSPVSLHHASPSAGSICNSDVSYPHTPQSFDPYFPSLVSVATPGPTPMPMSAGHQPPFGWPSSNLEPPSSDELLSGMPPPQELSEDDKPDADPAYRPGLLRAYSAPQVFHFTNHESSDFDTANDAFHDWMPTKSHAMTAEEWFTSMPIPSPAFFQLHPRMQYLLNYYDTSICPVLVSADGPSNPYRGHILRLAMHSPGLQSAIAALTTNNIRMRRLKAVPRRSATDPSIDTESINQTLGLPDAEEQHYKARSIEFLNKQLADPLKAREDSVLATLLILCLFHVCDSGVSKFKTQLAGVQKLIRMRGGLQPHSEFVGWVEATFAWFDVFTAAANDRETLFTAGVLESRSLARGLEVVALYSGCDARLFPMLARLSHVNMLSQSRTAAPSRQSTSSALPPPPTPRAALSAPAKDFYSLPRESLEQGELYTGDLNPQGSPPARRADVASSAPDTGDARRAFWAEWQRLRDQLAAYTPPAEHADEGAPAAVHDAAHAERARTTPKAPAAHAASAALRDAALVYLTRLSSPTLPPSAPQLQEHVSSAIAHLRALAHAHDAAPPSKFLLWALLVVGAECAAPDDRAAVRAALDALLAQSGFHNNVAAAGVLERVWDEADRAAAVKGEDAAQEEAATAALQQQPFAWRRCMDRADGEYIIV